MTEAERALVEWCLDPDEQAPTRLAWLAATVRAERIPADSKRKWMDIWKTLELARRAAKHAEAELGLPTGFDTCDWRAEARKELEQECPTENSK